LLCLCLCLCLQAVSGGLGQQRSMFEGISGKMSSLGSKFPVVNTLMNAIRRRKNRVRDFLDCVHVCVCWAASLCRWVRSVMQACAAY
jgi:Golgi SNAP receptor complex protein 1